MYVNLFVVHLRFFPPKITLSAQIAMVKFLGLDRHVSELRYRVAKLAICESKRSNLVLSIV